MKKHLICIVGALLFILLVLSCMGLFLPNYHLVSRYGPDGTPITTFVEPENWKPERWISSEYTVYAGEWTVVSKTVIQKHLFDQFTITRTDQDGKTEAQTFRTSSGIGWDAAGVPIDTIRDYSRGGYSSENLAAVSFWGGEGWREPFSAIKVRGGIMLPKPEIIPKWEAAWDENGRMIRQDQVYDIDPRDEERELLGYMLYTYDDQGRPASAEEYDADGILVGSAVYHYTGGVCMKHQYDPTGVRTGHVVEERNLFGQIISKWQCDAEGDTLSICRYSYSPWGLFRGWQGLGTILLVIALSVSVYVLMEKLVMHLEEKRQYQNKNSPTTASRKEE